jgi:hypothetical protein
MNSPGGSVDLRDRQLSEVDSPAAWRRLRFAVAVSTIGSVGMWSMPVALPFVQADFGSAWHRLYRCVRRLGDLRAAEARRDDGAAALGRGLPLSMEAAAAATLRGTVRRPEAAAAGAGGSGAATGGRQQWRERRRATKRIRWFEDSNGSPSFNHCWMIWDRQHRGPPTLAYASRD